MVDIGEVADVVDALCQRVLNRLVGRTLNNAIIGECVEQLALVEWLRSNQAAR